MSLGRHDTTGGSTYELQSWQYVLTIFGKSRMLFVKVAENLISAITSDDKKAILKLGGGGMEFFDCISVGLAGEV